MRKFWAQRLPKLSQPVIVPRGTVAPSRVLVSSEDKRAGPATRPPRRGSHRHNPNSRWSQKHRLYNLAREEVRDVYNAAYRDPVTAEVVAMRESVLLDVDQGEVLQQSLRYQRRFDTLNR